MNLYIVTHSTDQIKAMPDFANVAELRRAEADEVNAGRLGLPRKGGGGGRRKEEEEGWADLGGKKKKRVIRLRGKKKNDFLLFP